MFKNAKFAQLDELNIGFEALGELLSKAKYIDITEHQESSIGFVSPLSDDGTNMMLSIGKAHLIRLKLAEKKVPASAINDEVGKKIAKRKENDPKYQPSKAERTEMKEEIKHSLLPKVLPSYSYIDMYLDSDRGLFVVNTTSDNKWDIAQSRLKDILGENLSFSYFEADCDIEDSLTRWVNDWDMPVGFTGLEECRIKDTGVAKTEINYKRHDLESDQTIKAYLQTMKVIKLAMEKNDEVTFSIDGAMTLSGIKYLDMYKEKRKENLSGKTDEDTNAEALEQDADFAIMLEAFGKLIPSVVGMFKE